MKTFKKFTCIRCLEDKDILTDKETNPLFLCSSCVIIDKTRHDIIVELKGAPAGRVKGTSNPLKTKNTKTAYKGN